MHFNKKYPEWLAIVQIAGERFIAAGHTRKFIPKTIWEYTLQCNGYRA